MRILHVVKTSDGADWAARQAAVLAELGAQVHVAVPSATGRAIPLWETSGATVHVCDVALHPMRLKNSATALAGARQLVSRLEPDIIHSHHVATTLGMRLALGSKHRIPRIFQVPGPLHLEHWAPRQAEIRTAGAPDHWIASSRYIAWYYRKAGVPARRLFLSYHGSGINGRARSGFLRRRLGLPEQVAIVGNINFIYPPKYYLGQTVGLKCHEDVIDALGLVLARRPDVRGVLIGTTFGRRSRRYEQTLRRRALEVGKGRILMPGYFTAEEVAQSWPDFDCAVHVPLSENCGGTIEPLMCGVPTVASNVGGLPEVVIDNVTGRLVPPRNPGALAIAILEALADPLCARKLAANGQRLARRMFDIRRTAAEVYDIYRHLLTGSPRPCEFVPNSADWDPVTSGPATQEATTAGEAEELSTKT